MIRRHWLSPTTELLDCSGSLWLLSVVVCALNSLEHQGCHPFETSMYVFFKKYSVRWFTSILKNIFSSTLNKDIILNWVFFHRNPNSICIPPLLEHLTFFPYYHEDFPKSAKKSWKVFENFVDYERIKGKNKYTKICFLAYVIQLNVSLTATLYSFFREFFKASWVPFFISHNLYFSF